MPRTETPFPERELAVLAREYEEAAAMWSRSGPHGRLASKATARAALVRQAIAAYRELAGQPLKLVNSPFRPQPSPAGSGEP